MQKRVSTQRILTWFTGNNWTGQILQIANHRVFSRYSQRRADICTLPPLPNILERNFEDSAIFHENLRLYEAFILPRVAVETHDKHSSKSRQRPVRRAESLLQSICVQEKNIRNHCMHHHGTQKQCMYFSYMSPSCIVLNYHAGRFPQSMPSDFHSSSSSRLEVDQPSKLPSRARMSRKRESEVFFDR